MLRKAIFLTVYCLMAGAGTVSADQAAWISGPAAEKASELISPGTTVRKFCAPCGDTRWTENSVDRVVIRQVSDTRYQVLINGQGVDLAYLYFSRDGKWQNLALFLNLPVSDVPAYLPAPEPLPVKERLHSIDRRLAECMVKDDTTAGMTHCLFAAYDMWDGELNRIYQELRGRLQPEGQTALKAAQSEWLQYRDLEFALIDNIYAGFEGTMYTPMRVEDRMNIVKNRVMELKSYIDLMEN
jgi:uncharacterized protein YecT (DUF1311 family)